MAAMRLARVAAVVSAISDPAKVVVVVGSSMLSTLEGGDFFLPPISAAMFVFESCLLIDLAIISLLCLCEA